MSRFALVATELGAPESIGECSYGNLFWTVTWISMSRDTTAPESVSVTDRASGSYSISSCSSANACGSDIPPPTPGPSSSSLLSSDIPCSQPSPPPHLKRAFLICCHFLKKLNRFTTTASSSATYRNKKYEKKKRNLKINANLHRRLHHLQHLSPMEHIITC